MQTPSPLHLLPFPKQALRQTGGARRLGKGPWKQVHLGPKRWLQSAACGLLWEWVTCPRDGRCRPVWVRVGTAVSGVLSGERTSRVTQAREGSGRLQLLWGQNLNQ